MSADTAGTVTRLCEAWEDARRAGTPVTPEDLCRDHPEALPEVRRAVAALSAAGHALGPNDARPPADGPPPELPPDCRYELRRFLAAGGLGRVYVGFDRELGREVAVKFVRPGRGSEAAERRFRREAEITGRLEHRGVVPVYGLVGLAGGSFCYAMRLLAGRTLADAVDHFHGPAGPAEADRRREFRRLLGHVVEVCQTMAYAHRQGVIHRDLKPANVMLGEFGETWVLDWGLAKAAGALPDQPADEPAARTDSYDPSISTAAGRVTPVEGSTAKTAYGVGIGTPGFSSPEQRAGAWDRVGPAADVYSLGATLGAVLVGRGPRPNERPADWLAGATPAALAAVARRAMADDPAARYPSAEPLATDLQAWLDDAPVSAYRDPPLARAARWVRRHRTAAAAAAAVVLVAGVASAVWGGFLQAANASLVQQTQRAEDNLRAAEAQRAVAETQRAKAESSARDARDAVGKYYAWVSESRLLNEPGSQPLRKELLAYAAVYYEKFAQERAADPAAAADLGQTYLRLAHIRAATGDKRRAIEAAEQARAVFAASAATDPQFAAAVAECDFELSLFYAAADRPADAAAALGRADAAFTKLTGNRLARAITRAAGSAFDAAVGRYEQALAGCQAGIDLLDAPGPAAPPLTPPERQRLGAMYLAKAVYLGQLQRPAEAEAAARRGCDLYRDLARGYPRVTEAAIGAGTALLTLGEIKKAGGPAGAVPPLEEAVGVLEPLAAGNPAVIPIRVAAGLAQHRLGEALSDLDRKPEAEAAFLRAVAHRMAVFRNDPADRKANDDVADSCRGVVNATKKTVLVMDTYDAVVRVLDDALRADPADPARKANLVRALDRRATGHMRISRFTDAVRDYDRVIALTPDDKRGQVVVNRAIAVAHVGDHAGAVRDAEAVAGRGPPALGLYEGTARVCAAAVAAVNADDALGPDAKAAAAERYTLRTFAWLRKAIDRGGCTPAFLKNNTDLAAVRRRPEFQKLVAEVEAAPPKK